jgi:hypothetical protein
VTRKEAAAEASFYGLIGLYRALTAPPLDLETILGPDLVAMRDVETRLRAAFCQPSTGTGIEAHKGLLSLFAEPLADCIGATLTHEPDPCAFPTLLNHFTAERIRATSPLQGVVGRRVCVASVATFRTNFNQLHPNMLNRLAPVLATGKVLIAGGSVLHALTHETRLGGIFGPPSDIDLFLTACTSAEATALTKVGPTHHHPTYPTTRTTLNRIEPSHV